MRDFHFISGKPLAQFTEKEFHDLILSYKGKWKAPKLKKELSYWSARMTPKGNPSVTVRHRDPKHLFKSEVQAVLKKLEVSEDALLEYLNKRGIEVRND